MASFQTVVLTIALTAAPASLAAQSNDEGPRQARVSFRDLNLTTAEGVAALKRRVESAAAKVCSRNSDQLTDKLKERSCERVAREQAQMQIELAVHQAGTALAMSEPTSEGTSN